MNLSEYDEGDNYDDYNDYNYDVNTEEVEPNISIEVEHIPNKNTNTNPNYVPYKKGSYDISFKTNIKNNVQQPVNSNSRDMTYDDILDSLHVRMNNGVLQSTKPLNQNQPQLQKSQKAKSQKLPANKNNLNNAYNPQMKRVSADAPINPLTENSYIYNKYFKQYKSQEEAVVEPITFSSPEEYKAYVIQKRIEHINQVNRIKQIKSKKLMFHTGNINVSNNLGANNNNLNLNKLFRFVGK